MVDRRTWAALAFATLVSSVLGMPYSEFLASQGPGKVGDPMLRLLVQLVLTVLVTWPLTALGLALAARLGLGAPLLGAWFEDRLEPGQARRALVPAALMGLAYGGALLLLSELFSAALAREMARLGPMPVPPPLWMGVLGSFAAGITEETLLRLFFLSAIALPLARALPRVGALWAANVVAALVFGALHFGNVAGLGWTFTPFLVAYVLGVNGALGVLCGWLFWTRGIEAAIACHIACDLVLHGLAPALGLAGES